MTFSGRPGRRARGCGCVALLVVVGAVVMVVALVAFLLSALGGPEQFVQRQPVPEDVPPAAATPPPAIDVHAPGRTANELHAWAAPIAEEIGVDPQAVRAYGNAALIAAEAWPACNLQWNTLAGIGWVETCLLYTSPSPRDS